MKRRSEQSDDRFTPEQRAGAESLVRAVEALGGTKEDLIRVLRSHAKVRKYKTDEEIEEAYHAGDVDEDDLPLHIYKRVKGT